MCALEPQVLDESLHVGKGEEVRAVGHHHGGQPERRQSALDVVGLQRQVGSLEQLARQLSNAGMGLNAWWAEPLPNGKPDVSFIKHGQWGIFERK